jgi:hypothetical protein
MPERPHKGSRGLPIQRLAGRSANRSYLVDAEPAEVSATHAAVEASGEVAGTHP